MRHIGAIKSKKIGRKIDRSHFIPFFSFKLISFRLDTFSKTSVKKVSDLKNDVAEIDKQTGGEINGKGSKFLSVAVSYAGANLAKDGNTQWAVAKQTVQGLPAFKMLTIEKNFLPIPLLYHRFHIFYFL